jgi:hypothetical protein
MLNCKHIDLFIKILGSIIALCFVVNDSSDKLKQGVAESSKGIEHEISKLRNSLNMTIIEESNNTDWLHD